MLTRNQIIDHALATTVPTESDRHIRECYVWLTSHFGQRRTTPYRDRESTLNRWIAIAQKVNTCGNLTTSFDTDVITSKS